MFSSEYTCKTLVSKYINVVDNGNRLWTSSVYRKIRSGITGLYAVASTHSSKFMAFRHGLLLLLYI